MDHYLAQIYELSRITVLMISISYLCTNLNKIAHIYWEYSKDIDRECSDLFYDCLGDFVPHQYPFKTILATTCEMTYHTCISKYKN